ncbi:MAG: carboxypeptidase-like regulatory domain-containing protein, partial [Bacteroidota bacterium]|nr:carboxypeptidase-like regulatory domain-containing protein [Bacteroidota bacterium]
LYVFVIPSIQLLCAQQDTGTVLSGRISDIESGDPLENVIVFLSNTPIGTSSGKDGIFRIASVFTGEYEMVISRVGYERQIITLKVVKPESLYFEIKLQPQPVRTKEVEIIAEAPEDVKPFFFPKDNPGMFCMYGKVSTIPIGVFFADSALYMYTLEPVVLDSVKYIRLWLLYKNLSQTQYDFNPRKLLKLHMKGKTYSIKEIPPDLPSAILPLIDTQQIISRITETVGSSLEALATKHTLFINEQSHFELLLALENLLKKEKTTRYGYIIKQKIKTENDKPLKYYPSTNGSFSSRLYTIFQNSVNVGIMKRYLVFPENSINGYIYFPFPGLNWKATGDWFYEAAKYTYELELITPNGSKIITFTPH